MTGDKIEKFEDCAMNYLSDLEMAFKVRMLMRNDLDHEAVCTAARDRIMWLSQQLEEQRTKIIEDCATIAERLTDRYDRQPDIAGSIREQMGIAS
jgi:hypothetical protein